MPMTNANSAVPQTVVFDDGNRPDEAVRIGPSMRGFVFRSSHGSHRYRLIPIADAPIEWRHEIRSQAPRNESSLVTADRDWQQNVNGATWVVVRYAPAGNYRTLAELIAEGDPTRRLKACAACLRRLPDWRRALATPLWSMPADIVVSPEGDARWLWIPRGMLPGAREVFQDACRLPYLAPEYVRNAGVGSWDAAAWEACDRFALGACLLECFYQFPPARDAAAALPRAAAGTMFSRLVPRADLPPWLAQFSDYANTLAPAKRLCSPDRANRSGVDLQALAQKLDQSLDLFDPHRAASMLRDRAKPQEALQLLQDVFPRAAALSVDAAKQYDLLCLAGELCAQFLQVPLDAVDFFERAIVLDPERDTAYREQFGVIARARHHASLSAMIENRPADAVAIDVKFWRNYRFLRGTEVCRGEDEETREIDRLTARYALWRRQFDVARDFIYPRLFTADGTYAWWDIEFNLSYVESFLGLETGNGAQLDKASEQLQLIKNGLAHLQQQWEQLPEQFDPGRMYGEEIADLEYHIFTAKQALKR